MKRRNFLKTLLTATMVAVPTVMVGQQLINPTSNLKGVRYELSEENDCTVTAITVAFEAEYRDVHRHLNHIGIRKDGEGVELSKLSVNIHTIADRFNGHTLPFYGYGDLTLSEFAKTYNSGTFLIVMDGHIVTVKDGNIYDTNRNYYHSPIKGVWSVILKAKPLNNYTY